jgi:hypothetical protein
MEYRPMAQLPKGIDEMLRGYLECAEWCGLQDDDREALELSVSPKWDAESLRQAEEDCAAFLAENRSEIGDRLSEAGRDFWLTRNHHGAGFWDGDWEAGSRLTLDAHTYGGAWVGFDASTETLSLS